MPVDKEQLKNKDYLEKIKMMAEDIASENRFREAYDLNRELEKAIGEMKNLKEGNYDLYVEYKKIIYKLKWLGLPIMKEEEVIDMFQHHFTQIFKIDGYDIWSKLRIILLGIVVFEDRDEFKKKLRQALINSQEKITSKKLIINKQEVPPTVANWISDYNKSLGTGEINDLARAQYLVNGKNIINLNKEEKEKIKILFDLYEKLKLSSFTLEGLEEDISVDRDNLMGTIRAGVFEPYRETEKEKQIWDIIEGKKIKIEEKSNVTELRQLASQYKIGSLERRAIEEEIAKIEGGGIRKLGEEIRGNLGEKI